MEETFTLKESVTGKILHRIILHTICTAGNAIIVADVPAVLADAVNTARILIGTWI